MTKKYQVFVSSTFDDLKEEREAVIKCLLDSNCIPVGMEQFPASSMSQWEYITKMLEYTDYIVLITAGKYGSINKASGNDLSYTEEEYDYAQEKGIPVLTFIIKDPNKLTADKIEFDLDIRNKLNNFQEKLKNKQLVKFYTDVDDLKAQVATAINQAIQDIPAIGWIRANEISNDSSKDEMAERLSRMEKEIAERPIIKFGKEEANSENCPPGTIYFKYE